MKTVSYENKYSKLSPDTIVSINLSGNGSTPGERIAVSAVVPISELPIVLDDGDVETVEYPQDEIDEVNSNEDLTVKEKLDKIKNIISDYTKRLEEFENKTKSKTVTDEVRLLLAVREYLIEKYNFGRTQEEPKPYIEASDMQVTIIKTPNGDSIASVSGTSVWG